MLLANDRVACEQTVSRWIELEQAVVPTAFPRKMKDVADALASGRSDKINGAEITISKAWCSQGYQLGVGLDETGRRIAFSISLSTGQGLAAPL